MTITSQLRSVDYLGNGSTTSFPYPFKIFADSDLTVTLIDSGGGETIQTLTTQYSVTNAGEAGGGNVVMVSAPSTGETLRIERDIPFTQPQDYRNSGSFLPETLEDALDRVTMLSQQAWERDDATTSTVVDTRLAITEYTTATLPTASSTHDRELAIVRDAGQPDVFKICLRQSDGSTYEWVDLPSPLA